MKLYLAGPMTGLPLFNFPAFHEAAARLRAKGHEVYNAAEVEEREGFNPATGIAKDHAHYMAKALPEVCRCEAVALLPGWSSSKGCAMELFVAKELDKPIFTVRQLCQPNQSPPSRNSLA